MNSTQIAVLFAFLSAIGWGVAPVLVKKSLSQEQSSNVLVAFIYSLCGSIALSILVLSSSSTAEIADSFSLSSLYPFILSGIIASGIGRILNAKSIAEVGASITTPFTSMNTVVAGLMALAFLEESFSLIQGFGLLVLVAGLSSVSYSKGGSKSGWKKRQLIYPIVTSLLFGSGAVLRRFGLTFEFQNAIQATLVNEVSALAILAAYIGIFLDTNPTDIITERYVYLVVAALLNTLGVVSLFVSLNNGPVIIGTSVSATYAVVTLISTRVIANDLENVSIYQVIGTILSLLSLVLIVVPA